PGPGSWCWRRWRSRRWPCCSRWSVAPPTGGWAGRCRSTSCCTMTERTEATVVAHQVVRVYRGLTEEVQAVRGVDLVLERGSLTAVLVPSGSGKSTLIRLLAGLDRPSAGTITHGSTVLTELSAARLRRWRHRTVAFVHQRPRSNLVEHLTAADHIRMAGHDQPDEVLG